MKLEDVPDYNRIPVEFSNAIAELSTPFDWMNWRKSPEWKMFVRGFNACVREVNNKTQARYNMRETANRVFGT